MPHGPLDPLILSNRRQKTLSDNEDGVESTETSDVTLPKGLWWWVSVENVLVTLRGTSKTYNVE